ncbi:hypothetical protein R1flu_022073 [Riccia fluitans]|uniref:Uncharacterized protein n=1 Tax=Riccia fluitans TaxID=41844 RepID=A0ABD1ZSI8_9MARC
MSTLPCSRFDSPVEHYHVTAIPLLMTRIGGCFLCPTVGNVLPLWVRGGIPTVALSRSPFVSISEPNAESPSGTCRSGHVATGGSVTADHMGREATTFERADGSILWWVGLRRAGVGARSRLPLQTGFVLGFDTARAPGAGRWLPRPVRKKDQPPPFMFCHDADMVACSCLDSLNSRCSDAIQFATSALVGCSPHSCHSRIHGFDPISNFWEFPFMPASASPSYRAT